MVGGLHDERVHEDPRANDGDIPERERGDGARNQANQHPGFEKRHARTPFSSSKRRVMRGSSPMRGSCEATSTATPSARSASRSSKSPRASEASRCEGGSASRRTEGP